MTPFDIANAPLTRRDFYAKVIGKDYAEVKSRWAQLVFTGKGAGSQELAGGEDVVKAVAAESHAIGYVDSSFVNIHREGHLYGEMTFDCTWRPRNCRGTNRGTGAVLTTSAIAWGYLNERREIRVEPFLLRIRQASDCRSVDPVLDGPDRLHSSLSTTCRRSPPLP